MNKKSTHSSYTIIKTVKIDMFGIISLATYENQMVIIRDLNIKNKLFKLVAKYLNHNEVKILKKINRLNSPNFSKLIKSIKVKKYLTYGLNKKSNFRIKNITQSKYYSLFDLSVKLPGKKNFSINFRKISPL